MMVGGREARVRKGVVYGLTFVFALVMIAPFAFMVSTAFKPHAFVLEVPPQLIPEQITLDNFTRAWSSGDFPRYFLNSVLVTAVSTAISVSLAAMLGFTFARYAFPGRRVLFAALLFTTMVPGMVLLIPQFIVARDLGLLNSLWGLILVYAVMNLGLNTFLLRGFYAAMPQDLFDAAAVDGAGPWRAFRSVALPLSRPGLATVTIFSWLAAWDEFTWAITILADEQLYTLPIGIRNLQVANQTEWGLVFAASLMALAPVLVLFVALQKQFVSNAFAGATKG
jgi:multiple sugar transport system permease protein